MPWVETSGWTDSTLGKGSRFCVEIPFAVSEDETQTHSDTPKDTGKDKSISLRGMKFLCAEDVQHCLDAGMNAHIAKPVNFEKLKEILQIL